MIDVGDFESLFVAEVVRLRRLRTSNSPKSYEFSYARGLFVGRVMIGLILSKNESKSHRLRTLRVSAIGVVRHRGKWDKWASGSLAASDCSC